MLGQPTPLRLPAPLCVFGCVLIQPSPYSGSQVGAYHLSVKIDSVVAAMTNLFAAITGRMPRFR